MNPKILLSLCLVCLSLLACHTQPSSPKTLQNSNPTMNPPNANQALATFGAGCFWCVEAIFQQLKGVDWVRSGYTGGQVPNPSYKAVCEGTTGHAEVIQIAFQPEIISYETLLEIFWLTHDPTTLNRQGADVGTQYRSAIFYHNEEQKQQALQSKEQAQNLFDDPIVTEISPLQIFYIAEDYHQDYYNLNGGKNPYCSNVISPKIQKFRKKFADKIKDAPE